jgi:ATP-binding cassette, subfamily C, bacterial CydD
MAPSSNLFSPVRDTEVSAQTRQWLREQTQPAQRWLLLAIGAGGAEGVLLVVGAWLVAAIVHGACFGGRGVTDLWLHFGGFLAAVSGRAGANYLRERAGFHAGALVRRSLREMLVGRLLQDDPSPDDPPRAPAGALATAAVEQVEELHDYVARFLPQRGVAVVVPLTIVLAVVPASWAAAGILLFTAPLIPFLAWLVGMGAARASRHQFTALGRLGTHFVDRLRGLSTLRLLDRVETESRGVGEAAEELRRRTMKVLRIAFLTSAVLELFTALGVGLVAVYLGLALLGTLDFGLWGHSLTFQVALFVLILSAEFYLPLRGLGTLFHARASATGAAESLHKLLAHAQESSRAPVPHDDLSPAHGASATPLPEVVLDRVTVRSSTEDRALLKDVSLTLTPGEHLAVVGPSGAGKTTLIRVLLGAQAVSDGEVRAANRSLNDWSQQAWRRQLAWVGQQPRLFHGTLRENIALGRPDASVRAVEDAARKARVLDFARALPQGLDTEVGELGVGLSGGQIQRVALARALVKDAPLLLLDEPTANLDIENERLVLEGLAALTTGRTVVSVTHRLDACRKADRVAVLVRGRLVQLGSHAELAAADGPFARLAEHAPEVAPRPKEPDHA